jgi:hypothetical protein
VRLNQWLSGGAAALALAVGCAAWGGPLNRALVDKDASWMVHVDAEAAQKSSLQQILLNALDEDDKKKLEECRTRFGITPGEIKGITVYGVGIGDDGVAVLVTTGQADNLAERLPKAGLEDFKSRVDGNVHYFSFRHEDQTFHAAVRPSGSPDERQVLIAGNAESLEKGLKVARGIAPNLTFEPQPGNLMVTAQPDKASIVFVVARDIGNDPKAKANFLKNARGVVVEFGETAETPREMFFGLSLTAINPQVAEEMKQTCVGLVALGKMFAREHEIPGMVESLDTVKVGVEGDRLTVTSRERTEAVIAKVAQLKKLIDSDGGKRPGVAVKKEQPDAPPNEKVPPKPDEKKTEPVNGETKK